MQNNRVYSLATMLSLYFKSDKVNDIVEDVRLKEDYTAFDSPWKYCQSTLGEGQFHMLGSRVIVFTLVAVVIAVICQIHIEYSSNIMQIVRLSLLSLCFPVSLSFAVGVNTVMYYDRIPENAVRFVVLPCISIIVISGVMAFVSKLIASDNNIGTDIMLKIIQAGLFLCGVIMLVISALAILNVFKKTVWHFCVFVQTFGALLSFQAVYLLFSETSSEIDISLNTSLLLCLTPFIIGIVLSYGFALGLFLKQDDEY